jgi:anti-sigma factor RsiW
MNCEQVAPYLPGVAGGELGGETMRWVDAHLETCASCRADAARIRSVSKGLVALKEHDPVPPAFMVDSIMEAVQAEHRRRYLPVPPVVPAELIRVLSDNRDAIGTAAGVALAGMAAFALLRRAQKRRSVALRAT